MPFTPEEIAAWHAERESNAAKLDAQRREAMRPPPAANCFRCQIPFGWGEGTISGEFAICDVCDVIEI